MTRLEEFASGLRTKTVIRAQGTRYRWSLVDAYGALIGGGTAPTKTKCQQAAARLKADFRAGKVTYQ